MKLNLLLNVTLHLAEVTMLDFGHFEPFLPTLMSFCIDLAHPISFLRLVPVLPHPITSPNSQNACGKFGTPLWHSDENYSWALRDFTTIEDVPTYWQVRKRYYWWQMNFAYLMFAYYVSQKTPKMPLIIGGNGDLKTALTYRFPLFYRTLSPLVPSGAAALLT